MLNTFILNNSMLNTFILNNSILNNYIIKNKNSIIFICYKKERKKI